jgi:2-haloacid dehalogenase
MQDAENVQAKPQIILFDVYETLLDMSDLEKKVNGLFDSGKGYIVWFELFMEYCFVANCPNQYREFTAIAKATMQMAGNKLGKVIRESDIDFVLEMLKHLPVHENVQECLSELNDKGYRIAALTNSPEKVVCERMERTGLISYFENVFSAEKVKKYKPGLEVYEWAARKLEAGTKDIMLVSAHSWDIVGAASAGLQTAFLRKGKQLLYPLAPSPTLVCGSLTDLVNQLG